MIYFRDKICEKLLKLFIIFLFYLNYVKIYKIVVFGVLIMWKKKRHQRVIDFLRPFFTRYFKKKYNCSFDDAVSFPEGALFISNHVTTMDEFMIGILSK